MNDRRHLWMITGLAVALLAATLWSYGWLAAARDGAAVSAENLDQCRELAAGFAGAGIEVVALKGTAALLSVYREGGCRPLEDLDLEAANLTPEQFEG